MKKYTQLVCLTTVFLLPLHSYAASFNCSKAEKWAEKTICSSKQLSNLDDLLAASYKKALGSTDDQTGLKAEQREWLATRNACEDVECLKGAYTARIASLNEVIASENAAPDTAPSDVGSGWYKVSAEPNLVVRASPDVTGKKLGTAPYGGKIQVLGKTGNTDSIGGREGSWVKIQWQSREAYVFDAFLEPLSARGGNGGDKPKTHMAGKTIQGVIDSYECGDNCYLTIIDKQGEKHTGLCGAPLCESFSDATGIPSQYKNRKVQVSVGRGLQYDGGGETVMGEMDEFNEITLLN